VDAVGNAAVLTGWEDIEQARSALELIQPSPEINVLLETVYPATSRGCVHLADSQVLQQLRVRHGSLDRQSFKADKHGPSKRGERSSVGRR
jgi:hypothetical protein